MKEFLRSHLSSASIADISSCICRFFGVRKISGIKTEDKLDALCIAAGVSRQEMDEMIAYNPPAIRTIKGHAFEVIFSKILQINDIPHDEIGGDSDIDFSILGNTLQLKTPYVNGCTDQEMAYKTHKTHGAKSESESMGYYHLADDFADYLVGLIVYDPFQVFIIPRDDIPRHRADSKYLASPISINLKEKKYINNFQQLGISDDIQFPRIVNLGRNELLPLTAEKIGVRSNYIIDAIYRPENFRIWDMNLRGFIRENHIKNLVRNKGLKMFDPSEITDRPEKVDLVLYEKNNGKYVRFQIKGLTFGSSRLKGRDSEVMCETQLSRGRVNDHPTQSRLYLATDFDELLIAVDPAYTNTFSTECFGREDYNWSFYSIPVDKLQRHPRFQSRLKPNQYIRFDHLQDYRINNSWFDHYSTVEGKQQVENVSLRDKRLVPVLVQASAKVDSGYRVFGVARTEIILQSWQPLGGDVLSLFHDTLTYEITHGLLDKSCVIDLYAHEIDNNGVILNVLPDAHATINASELYLLISTY